MLLEQVNDLGLLLDLGPVRLSLQAYEPGLVLGLEFLQGQPQGLRGDLLLVRPGLEFPLGVIICLDLGLLFEFDELENLYMKPQAELHEVSFYEGIDVKGAQDIFDDAGVVVLSNNNVPEGKEYKLEWGRDVWGSAWKFMGGQEVIFADGVVVAPSGGEGGFPAPVPTPGAQLAEVQRIRQYFPETWLWQEVITGPDGQASIQVTVPDTITTWMLRAVALSDDGDKRLQCADLAYYTHWLLKC